MEFALNPLNTKAASVGRREYRRLKGHGTAPHY